MKTKKSARDQICDEILELLLIAYTYGCEDVNEMLGTEIAPTYGEMRNSIYRKIAGKNWEQRVDEYLDQYTESEEAVSRGETPEHIVSYEGIIFDLMRIAETDMHRNYNEAGYETAKQGGATTKKWICQFRNSRDTHIYLHGTTLPIDAEFYTFLGNHAMFPGQFGVAEEDCNCQCYLRYSA